MARVTNKLLETKVKSLNRRYGFKGRKYSRLKNKQLKITGSGFALDYAYGGVSLVFEHKNTTTQSNVSKRMKKAELAEYIDGMVNALIYYKDRVKLK